MCKINNLKSLITKTYIGKILREIVHSYNVKRCQKKRNREIAKIKAYGIEALKVFDQFASSLNITYTLATGTLLGAVREHGFIPHDVDIDVFMWIEDYSPEVIRSLEQVGFHKEHTFRVADGRYGREDSFVYKGVHFDIFYVVTENTEIPYFTDYMFKEGSASIGESVNKFGGMQPRRLYIPIVKEIIRVPFEDEIMPIPVNANEVLKARYGNDYMTPKPSWNAVDFNPNVKVWTGEIGIVE